MCIGVGIEFIGFSFEAKRSGEDRMERSWVWCFGNGRNEKSDVWNGRVTIDEYELGTAKHLKMNN
jgi:hypothetical protein